MQTSQDALDCAAVGDEDTNDTKEPPFSVVQNHLFCLDQVEGEVVILAPHCQVSDLIHIGCLIVVGDEAYHCCVVGRINELLTRHSC